MKKKVQLIILTVLLCLNMAGCQLQSANSKNINESMTINEGMLTVGTEVFYAPMEYLDENDELTGFDMELIQAMADEMNLEIQVVNMTWDSIFTGLDRKEYDVIVSSLSKTKERDEKYALTESYMDNAVCLVVAKESDISAIGNLGGKKVGVHLCSTSDMYVQNLIENGMDIELRQYETVYYAFEELKKGNLDAVIADEVVIAHNLKGVEDRFKTVWKSDESEPFCMCVRKDNEALLDELNHAYKVVEEKGIVAQLKEKYF